MGRIIDCGLDWDRSVVTGAKTTIATRSDEFVIGSVLCSVWVKGWLVVSMSLVGCADAIAAQSLDRRGLDAE